MACTRALHPQPSMHPHMIFGERINLIKKPIKSMRTTKINTRFLEVCCGERERETQTPEIQRCEVLQQFGLVIVYKRLLRGPGCLVLCAGLLLSGGAAWR